MKDFREVFAFGLMDMVSGSYLMSIFYDSLVVVLFMFVQILMLDSNKGYAFCYCRR